MRVYRPGLERRYRVAVEQDAGDRYGYQLRLRMVLPKTPKLPKGATAPPAKDVALKLEMRLTDYRATVSEQKVSAPSLGGGETAVEPNGLPNALSLAGPSGPIWMPLLCLYLPADDDKAFDFEKIDVGSGLAFSGKGTLSRGDGGVRIDSEGTFSSGEREMGRLTMRTILDREGWPMSAEGKLVNGDGTYRFTLGK